MPNRRSLILAGLSLPALGRGAAAWEPTRPIRLVVPFAAGGPADLFARVLAEAMATRLGQPVVVENRTGAGGVTGVDAVVKATPDGHVLALTGAAAMAIAPSLPQPMPFQVDRDLAQLTLVARVPEVLVVHAGDGIPDVATLILRGRDGALQYGSAGAGSITHLASALFALEAGITAEHIPYRGAAPAVTDLLGRRFAYMIADVPVLIAHIRAGTLKPLAVTTGARVAALPDVPTTAEVGLPRVLSDNWYGLAAPAGVPPDALARLHTAAVESLRDPALIARFASVEAIAAPMTPAATLAFIQSEQAKWAPLVRQTGVTTL
ncbi:Bug family tripartite tricarboxylate transporter substrate binding protein [Humitalea sp. 24SJ18S-53]|uniref:Bug family tripartite tricarboxylate transporter substrate binding protein n=1 Tax=Humitalea sp. 24SJ18S-53 TaxID=3422307 RepID=UPI003D674C1C